MSVPVGSRWFRQAGDIPPISPDERTNRQLSFEEGEESALLHAKPVRVRESKSVHSDSTRVDEQHSVVREQLSLACRVFGLPVFSERY